jgi:hypothetical protein
VSTIFIDDPLICQCHMPMDTFTSEKIGLDYVVCFYVNLVPVFRCCTC